MQRHSFALSDTKKAALRGGLLGWRAVLRALSVFLIKASQAFKRESSQPS